MSNNVELVLGRRSIFATLCLAVNFLASANLIAQEDRPDLTSYYEVKWVGEDKPVIDGVIGEDEWDNAAPTCDLDAAGNCRVNPTDNSEILNPWTNLRIDTADQHELRFQMMWDDTHLYILGQSNYGGFVPGLERESVRNAPSNPARDNTGYNGNLYFDPNTDNERKWDGEHVKPTEVDGYQISWDIYEGFAERRPTPEVEGQSLRDPLKLSTSDVRFNSQEIAIAAWLGGPDGGAYSDFTYTGACEPIDGMGPAMELCSTSAEVAVNGFEGATQFHLIERSEEQPDIVARPIVQNESGQFRVVGEPANDYYGGLYLEAHANALFGNQAAPGSQWELSDDGPNGRYQDDAFPELVFAQNADNRDVNGTEEAGAVWEWKIPWSVFDATNPNRLVPAAEAVPEKLVDEREEILIPPDHPDYDPFFPEETMPNPDFGKETTNPDWIGNEGEPDVRFSNPDADNFIDNGLYAPEGPEVGDIWGFEHAVITNDELNLNPSWSEPDGGDPTRGQFFASWGTFGHGQIKFLGEGDDGTIGTGTGGNGNGNGNEVTCIVPDDGILGDLDRNGTVDFGDFLVLSTNFGKRDLNYRAGDINCDGEVGFSDFLTLSVNFGRSAEGAAQVPEPNTPVMALAAGFFVGLLRRRRK